MASDLLDPGATYLGKYELDIWRLLNWFLTGYYWTILTNLGQNSPKIHPHGYGSGRHKQYPDFTRPVNYSPGRNIFVNQGLYPNSSSFLTQRILPFMNVTFNTSFADITDDNRSIDDDVYFQRSYNCAVRRWKAPAEAVISIWWRIGLSFRRAS